MDGNNCHCGIIICMKSSLSLSPSLYESSFQPSDVSTILRSLYDSLHTYLPRIHNLSTLLSLSHRVSVALHTFQPSHFSLSFISLVPHHFLQYIFVHNILIFIHKFNAFIYVIFINIRKKRKKKYFLICKCLSDKFITYFNICIYYIYIL